MSNFVPASTFALARSIVRSWNTPRSNYILVCPPLSNSEEVFLRILSSDFQKEVGLNPSSISIAIVSGRTVKNAWDFSRTVSSMWSESDNNGEADFSDASEMLECSARAVVDAGRVPIIIFREFHKAIEKLSWDIGSTLRDLEHRYSLMTVVEIPINLSTLQLRWERSKSEVPFLASDFGQGHSTKIVSGYNLDESRSVFERFGFTGNRFDELYALTGGIPGIIPWLAREAQHAESLDALHRIVDMESPEVLKRFFKWLDSPGERTFRSMVATAANKNDVQGVLRQHEWAPLIFNSNSLIPDILTKSAAMDACTEVVSAQVPAVIGAQRLFSKARIVVFADAWGTKHGGINAFNLDLCRGLRRTIPIEWEVTCIVPTRSCILEKEDGVTVYSLRKSGEERFILGDTTMVLNWLGLSDSLTVCVGHDAITGEISNVISSLISSSRCIIFSHMAYDNYYGLIGASDVSVEKVRRQRIVFAGADCIFAVGPKLSNYVEDQSRTQSADWRVVEYIPPLIETTVSRKPRRTPKITFVGRIQTGQDIVKQSRLAIQAIGRAIRNATSLDDVTVQIIGAVGPSNDSEDNVRMLLLSEAKRAVTCQYLEFSEDRGTTLENILDSSLVVMPSFHEGFGLVAWEAISAGIPVIISENSGVHKFLQRCGLSELVGHIKVGGGATEIEVQADIQSLADKITPMLINLGAFHERAILLREKLAESVGNGGLDLLVKEVASMMSERVQTR